jgi:hypothetical protein
LRKKRELIFQFIELRIISNLVVDK